MRRNAGMVVWLLVACGAVVAAPAKRVHVEGVDLVVEARLNGDIRQVRAVVTSPAGWMIQTVQLQKPGTMPFLNYPVHLLGGPSSWTSAWLNVPSSPTGPGEGSINISAMVLDDLWYSHEPFSPQVVTWGDPPDPEPEPSPSGDPEPEPSPSGDPDPSGSVPEDVAASWVDVSVVRGDIEGGQRVVRLLLSGRGPGSSYAVRYRWWWREAVGGSSWSSAIHGSDWVTGSLSSTSVVNQSVVVPAEVPAADISIELVSYDEGNQREQVAWRTGTVLFGGGDPDPSASDDPGVGGADEVADAFGGLVDVVRLVVLLVVAGLLALIVLVVGLAWSKGWLVQGVRRGS